MTTTATATATATTPLTTLTQLHKLEERYPFNEEELEILVRCYEGLKDDNDGFLIKLALSSPYSYFFLPGEEMRERVNWVEDHLLPPGFASNLRAATSIDSFVDYANQGEEKGLERFLEGIADTGRRGTKEALCVLYNIAGDEASPYELIDLCTRLAVAQDALVVPNLDKNAFLARLDALELCVQGLSQSLEAECYGKALTKHVFVEWAEDTLPMLSTPLSSFVHSLLFHGHSYPKSRFPFAIPELAHSSDILENKGSPLLTSLSFMSQNFGGKWQRLYSSFSDGRSFNRLEHSILGYGGPTLLLIKTTSLVTLGAFTSEPWKESKTFYGNADCFIFELSPKVSIHRPTGSEQNFMYLHGMSNSSLDFESQDLPRGLGFGGTSTKPRLFIPETFEGCSADFMDRTFESGDLLPLDALERFEIQSLEIWGVGIEPVIEEALKQRSEFRERSKDTLYNARFVGDRSQFAADMRSGLIPTNVFTHSQDVRGRSEFTVDEEHGGYKIERA